MVSASDKRGTHLGLDSIKHSHSLPPIPDPKELLAKAKAALREGSRSPHPLPQGSKRHRSSSPEGDLAETRAGSRKLIRPKASDTRVSPHEAVGLKTESPWQSLQKVYELKLDGFITVAVRRPPSCELVTVKSFVGSDSQQKMERLQQTHHENFVAFLETFRSEGSLHVVLDYIPISLAHMIASPAYPTELQLAAILGQVSSRYWWISRY